MEMGFELRKSGVLFVCGGIGLREERVENLCFGLWSDTLVVTLLLYLSNLFISNPFIERCPISS